VPLIPEGFAVSSKKLVPLREGDVRLTALERYAKLFTWIMDIRFLFLLVRWARSVLPESGGQFSQQAGRRRLGGSLALQRDRFDIGKE
jgi:hypothetical protein